MNKMTEYELEKFREDIKRLYKFDFINSEYYGDIIVLVTELINKSGVIFKLLNTVNLDQLELDNADK